MSTAICPGSFDPLHRGHEDVIRRAAALFDEVIVAVSVNYSKQARFTAERRCELAREVFADVPNLSVEILPPGLLAEFAVSQGASAIVKGLRHGSDLDYETPMAAANRLLTGVETVFLMTHPERGHLSSTLVKEIHALGGDVSSMVHPAVLQALDAQRSL